MLGYGKKFSTLGNTKLNAIIESAIEGKKIEGDETRTTVVNLHLAQIREYGARGGHILFRPIQDEKNIRRDFVNNLIKTNYLKKKITTALNRLVGRGEILWCLFPFEDSYKIDYFTGGKYNPFPEYWIMYEGIKPFKEISCACVLLQENLNLDIEDYLQDKQVTRNYNTGSFITSYLLFIDKSSYHLFQVGKAPESLQEVQMYYESLYKKKESNKISNEYQKIDHTFEDFPFVVCKNIYIKSDLPGVDDFNPHADLIEHLNGIQEKMGLNLETFSSPTLVTSKDSTVLDELNTPPETFASITGFRNSKPKKHEKAIPRMVFGIRDEDRFGYVQSPDVVSGDHNLYIRQNRELIHWCLGGVDPLGISANATFGEIKSLFGRLENTAKEKTDSLLGENGLSKLFELAILNEEKKAKIQITRFVLNQYFQGSKIAESLLREQITDDLFKALFEHLTKDLKIKLVGLPPLGNTEISWSYTRPVFLDTTRESLDKSIIFRNEREDGITQEISLSKLYPEMSDDALRQAMSGFSPRVVNSLVAAINQCIGLYQALLQFPSPEDPKIPWAVSLDLYQVIEQGILSLKNELSYNLASDKPDLNSENFNSLIQSLLNKINASLQQSNR